MVKNTSRPGRMSDLVQRELSRLIREDFSDPRFGMITVSSVLVTEDLSFARVFITVLDDSKQSHTKTIDELNDAVGMFRTNLAKKLSTRTVPKIKFIYDSSLIIGSRMEQLLNSVKSHDDEPAD
jgi:ribosome-binding factor A